MTKRFLRQPMVEHLTGLSGSTIWHRISQGTFPRPIKLGAQAVGWIDSEVDEWMDKMIEASRGQENPRDRGQLVKGQDAPTRDHAK